MPVLRVFDADGSLAPQAPLHIPATMLVPEGPDSDEWHLVAAALQIEADTAAGAASFQIDAGTLQRLYARGSEAMERDLVRRQTTGEQVGDILLTLHMLDREAPRHASREKAARLHARSLATAKGAALARAESKLGDRWREFAPVAPLWAAWRLLIRSSAAGGATDWPLLLAVAEHYRSFAEQHCPPVGRTGSRRAATRTTIPAGTAWTMPAHARLPDVPVTVCDIRGGRSLTKFLADTPA